MSTNLIALQNRFLGRGETIYDKLSRLRMERGVITGEDISTLAEQLRLPKALVRSVAEFYDELSPGAPSKRRLHVCNGEGCAARGGAMAQARLDTALADVADLELGEMTCLGYCGEGPNAMLEQDDEQHVFSLAGEAEATVIAALVAGQTPELAEPTNFVQMPEDPSTSVLLSRFAVDVDLTSARAAGAYASLAKMLKRGPDALLDELDASKLRGRGGAGFPAGRKLRTVRGAPCPDGVRYLVVNADEGDAGAFIDKELMERDPHGVIEGMLLAAFACGASEGFFYLRAEYPRAQRIMAAALDEARAAGLLGKGILGSGFTFDVRLVRGHGAYICGEETSLLRSLEGVPAQVSYKPPYPAEQGYRGAPTAVHNVETLACMPFIAREGGKTYAAFGKGESRGMKLFSVAGAVARPGLFELPLGVTLRELIYDHAGGMAEGASFRAAMVGGPLGGVHGEGDLDLPLTIEDLAAVGGMLGHGSVVVFSSETDLVRLGRDLMRFCAVESCGKCFPCRLGSVRGVELFDEILEGRGEQRHIELLAELSETMRVGSLCALGGAIPTPIDLLMKNFIQAFREHVPDAQVPALLATQEDAR